MNGSEWHSSLGSVGSVGWNETIKRVVSYCVTGRNAMLPSGPSGIDWVDWPTSCYESLGSVGSVGWNETSGELLCYKVTKMSDKWLSDRSFYWDAMINKVGLQKLCIYMRFRY